MAPRVRAALLGIFVFGAVGTATELLLLEHTEHLAQWVPLVLIAVSLAVLAAHAALRGPGTVRVFHVVMLAFLGAGVAGIALHFRGNVEFEREMHPGHGRWDLFRGAMTGATPALAPGTMIMLGAIGLLYAYRHPAVMERFGVGATPGEE